MNITTHVVAQTVGQALFAGEGPQEPPLPGLSGQLYSPRMLGALGSKEENITHSQGVQRQKEVGQPWASPHSTVAALAGPTGGKKLGSQQPAGDPAN